MSRVTPPDGLKVLITRPAGRADALADALAAAGGEGIGFPVLTVECDPSAILSRGRGLLAMDGTLVVLVSVYAVQALQLALEQGISVSRKCTFAVIGSATRAALEGIGLAADIVPHDAENSEGLLTALEGRDLSDRPVLILRGQSGRELLSTTLAARGARVVQLTCYRRLKAPHPPLQNLRRWLASSRGVVTVTSVAILEALIDRVPAEHAAELLSRPVVTLSGRIASACRSAGFHGVIEVSSGTDTASLLSAIHRADAGGAVDRD